MYGSSALVDLEIDDVKKTVKAFGREDRNKALIAQFFPGEAIDWTTINPPFIAQFRQDRPELGCRLVTPSPR